MKIKITFEMVVDDHNTEYSDHEKQEKLRALRLQAQNLDLTPPPGYRSLFSSITMEEAVVV